MCVGGWVGKRTGGVGGGVERERVGVCVVYMWWRWWWCVCDCVHLCVLCRYCRTCMDFMVLFHFFELIPCLDFKLFISWGGVQVDCRVK